MSAASDLIHKLARAVPGERIVYFIGYLPNALLRMDAERLGVIQAVRNAVDAGFIDVVQRRMGDLTYAYIAVKRKFRRAWHKPPFSGRDLG